MALFTLCAAMALSPAVAKLAGGASQARPTAASASSQTGVDGDRAMAYARQVLRFGPRPPGSPEIAALRKYIAGELRKLGIAVEERSFTARTPAGDVPMVNLIGRIPGNSGRLILLSGHYDTKRIRGVRFVGANDAGSSTAMLLELATALAKRSPAAGPRDEIWLVFFDGEEAFEEWTESDSLYGSRQLARELEKQGTLRSVRALINLDMIGDRDLNLAVEYNSTASLRELAMEVAAAQGHRDIFDRHASAIEDDHVPFARLGVPVLNLIDFSYGPGHAYWHTEADTIDKLSPSSFRIVGNLVLGILNRLNR
ncbi:MAG: M28 family peptidase [Bryobacterales bacterium]|nr:M28 family peptidase [Bryobacterales bacterium]